MKKFKKLQNIISEPRLSSYLNFANNDEEKAYHLYLYNLEISQILYHNIHWLEIILRNAINQQLIKTEGDNWYESDFLGRAEEKQISEIFQRHEEKQEKRNKRGLPYQGLNNTKIIGEINFGFWNGLFKPYYEKLWRHELRHIFLTNERLLCSNIYRQLSSIRIIRNRIAHHEPILRVQISKNLIVTPQDICTDIYNIIEMIEFECLEYLKEMPDFS